VRSLSELQSQLGFGLLLIEHDMNVIMRLCQRIQVLDYGKTLAVGTPAEVRADPNVVRAYLGDLQMADA
jgi:branched-chain amino acid transport system ATP-binding protein